MSPAIKNVGQDPYSSTDPETGQSFTLNPGDEIEVSDAKAAQVAEDFPEWLAVSGKGKTESEPAAAEEPAAEEPPAQPKRSRAKKEETT